MSKVVSSIIDISLPLYEGMITYPFATQVGIKRLEGTSVSSEIVMGSHSGTHIDAPAHVFAEGLPIDKIGLAPLVGKCRVLDLTASKREISREELESKGVKGGERILFKTANSLRGFGEFYDDYVYLSVEGARYLAELPVVCVGIDSLSIKQRGSRDSTAHTAFLSKNIPIIEGLDLSAVSEGEYTLVALPLSFTGIDGAPARVVLLR